VRYSESESWPPADFGFGIVENTDGLPEVMDSRTLMKNTVSAFSKSDL
jgi:hypothetical protein